MNALIFAVSDGDRLTAAEAAELRLEAFFLGGLLVLFLTCVALVWAAHRNAGRRPDPTREVVRTVVLDRQAPTELPPRWTWRGQSALLDDTPAALPPAPPPDPPVRPRALPVAHRRELSR